MKLTKRDIELLREVHKRGGILLRKFRSDKPGYTSFASGEGDTARKQTANWVSRMTREGALLCQRTEHYWQWSYTLTPEGLAAIGEGEAK